MNNKERARLIDALGSAIADGETSLGQVPQLLRKVLYKDTWMEFETQMGKRVTYQKGEFEKFVTKPPLEGLGTTLDFIKEIASKDIELQKLLAQALRLPRGTNQYTMDSTIGAIHKEGEGSGASQLSLLEQEKPREEKKKQERYGQRILRLEKKSPKLYAQVLSGEKTAHAAYVEAEIDHPTMTVTLDSPKSARSLIAKASPAFIEELRRLLTQ